MSLGCKVQLMIFVRGSAKESEMFLVPQLSAGLTASSCYALHIPLFLAFPLNHSEQLWCPFYRKRRTHGKREKLSASTSLLTNSLWNCFCKGIKSLHSSYSTLWTVLHSSEHEKKEKKWIFGSCGKHWSFFTLLPPRVLSSKWLKTTHSTRGSSLPSKV